MATKRATPASVAAYISSFPPATQRLLKQLQQTIRSAAPQAQEMISYGIAGYKQDGMLIFFAGFANHVSVYPAPRTAPAFKKELAAYKGGKGTVQFPLDHPLPLDLVKRIVQYRLQENEARAATQKAPAKKAVRVPKGQTADRDQAAVQAWLDRQDPELRQQINAVRKIILASSPLLQERIKWNAPSYYAGEDIVTFGPYRNNRLLLVFHHPAVVNIPSPLLEGKMKDRRLLYIDNPAAARKMKKELTRIIQTIVQSLQKK